MQTKLMAATAEALGRFYALPVKTLDRLDLTRIPNERVGSIRSGRSLRSSPARSTCCGSSDRTTPSRCSP